MSTTTSTTRELYDRYVIPTYARFDLRLARGKGSEVWDEDGKRYLDFGAGIAVTSIGHAHPRVIANCGLDPDEWQGFAFGCGIDRLAMLKYGMDDLRAFFGGDIRWLQHYGFGALDVPTLSGGVSA